MGRSQEGSIAVEMAVTVPFLVLLVVGGWILGYMVYSKVALAMIANRAARELAADRTLYGRLEMNQPVRFDGGFGESYGLPRWGVHAVAMKTFAGGDLKNPADHVVLVAACYRVPFAVPFAVVEREQRPGLLPDTAGGEELVLDAADLAGLLGEQGVEESLREAVGEYREQKRELEEEIAAWGRLKDRADSAWSQIQDIKGKVEWLGRLLGQLTGREPPDMQKYGKRVESAQLEGVARTLCQPPERLKEQSMVMSARAAYLVQVTWEGGGS